MLHRLTLHPQSACRAVERIEVETVRAEADKLALRYVVTGRINELAMPMLTPSSRVDELWKHTCLEAFIKAPRRKSYCEFNFAPSSQWAAYRFRDYRKGMAPILETVPTIDVKPGRDRFELRALLDFANVKELPVDGAWRLGLSAVIEDVNGSLSYWALKHPGRGKPNFHHADGFAAELALAKRK
jgi:hypothetical protein